MSFQEQVNCNNGALKTVAVVPEIHSDTKLLRKYSPENYLSEFLRGFAPSKSPGKKDFFKELRMKS